MKHLILGSSGQIGAHLVKYLQDKGEQVLEYDLELNKGDKHNTTRYDLRIQGEYLLDCYINSCDIVYFLAFDVGGAKYLEKYQDSYKFISNNFKIMDYTFEAIKKYHKPFIFASSQMAEMGYSSYGMLKSLGEKITHDIGGIVARFWNVYGYETDEEKSHVITDFIKMAKHQKAITMRTDGTESRQFLYADDACEALFILGQKYNQVDKEKNYSITSFKWHKIYEIANILDVLSSCKVFPGDKKDETQYNAMNEPNNHIQKYWQPKTSLEDGIIKLYNMY